MRNPLLLLALGLASVAMAQSPTVVEKAFSIDNQPTPFAGAIGGNIFTAISYLQTQNGSFAATASFGNMAGGNYMPDSPLTKAFNGFEIGATQYFAGTHVTSGGQTEVAVYNKSGSSVFRRFLVSYPGPVNNIVGRHNAGATLIAWLAPGPTPSLVLQRDAFTFAPQLLPLPGVSDLVDIQVLPTGVSFATVKKTNGQLIYHSIFSGGKIRWSLPLPSGAKAHLDPDGRTWVVFQNAGGVQVQRYDFNANLEGATTLPAQFGTRLDGSVVDNSRYFFVLASHPENGKRVSKLVRLNPALTPLALPLEGYLATGKPSQMATDTYGQVYAQNVTTASGILTERTFAFNARRFVPAWTSNRAMLATEQPSNLVPTRWGLYTWNNRTSPGGLQGFAREFQDTGFQSVTGSAQVNGGGNFNLTLNFYRAKDVYRNFRVTVNSPDVTIAPTAIVYPDTVYRTVPWSITPSAVARVIKFEFEDLETGERQSHTVTVRP